MRSSTIPGSRTRSRRSEARHRGRYCVAVLAAGTLFGTHAAAHDLLVEPIPVAPGVRLGAAIAVSLFDAEEAVPVPTLPGVLTSGATATDRRGLSVEHGVVDGGIRLNEHFGATFALGWHGADTPHFEAAWLEGRRSAFTAGAGRNRVPLGPVITAAGHMDRFAFMPLAKEAAFGGDWIDDGLNLHWRDAGPGELEVDAGLWRGASFPGVAGSAPAPALHVGGTFAQIRFDGFYARLQPEGRGMPIQRSSDGHQHDVPSCADSIAGLVCFDGSTDLAGASLRWHAQTIPFELALAGILRHEAGSLYSTNGDTDYRGWTNGGWVDATWSFSPELGLSMRAERLVARHELSGQGATLVARDAGLLPDPGPASRLALALVWTPRTDTRLTLEAGSERINHVSNDYIGVRFLWAGSWSGGLCGGC